MTPPTRTGDAWVQTWSGKAFWLLDPRPEDVDPRDLAHALAHLCRFGGHCREFYSVAEHCVHLSRQLDDSGDATLALHGLLHDGAEAYICDVPRPLKRLLRDYGSLEMRIAAAVYKRFGLNPNLASFERQLTQVDAADERMLATEQQVLMPDPPAPWKPLPAPYPLYLPCWTPLVAEVMFRNRLVELGVAL